MIKRNGCISKHLQKKMDDLFCKAIENRVFPGAAVGVSVGLEEKRKIFILTYGSTEYDPKKSHIIENKVFFDLASLTKPLAATLAVMVLIKEGKLHLEDTLPDLFEYNVPEEKKHISLRQLLNHCSGFASHRPFFEKLVQLPENARIERLQNLVMEEPLVARPGEKEEYSDLGFMVIGWIIEKKTGIKLDKFVVEKVFRPLGVEEGLFFIPPAAGQGEKHDRIFAATEDCPWRGRILRGEVSDDNTSAVGGVSGQAGLFGNIESMLEITVHILDQWQGRKNHPHMDAADLKYFLKRQEMVKGSTWALGFDTPSRPFSSSGHYLSPNSVGHLGFTGTSFWIDPEKETVIVLLTNRVHPTRENNKIRTFRPLFHDTVIEALGLV